MVELVIGRWFLSIEVVKSNIGMKEGDGILDGGGVLDDGISF